MPLLGILDKLLFCFGIILQYLILFGITWYNMKKFVLLGITKRTLFASC